MRGRQVIKVWVAAFLITVGGGLAWDYGKTREIELYLGSYLRDRVKENQVVMPTQRLDFEGRRCTFVVNQDMELEMLKLVFGERQKAGKDRLVVDGEMTQIARLHAKDMADKKYFSHQSLNLQDAGDRLTEAGISYQVVGENLAYGASVASAHKGLMKSESHKQNILEDRFGRLGIGVLSGGECGILAVQNFAD